MDYYKEQTYYDVLGVSMDASYESIRRARDRLKYGNSEDRVPMSKWPLIDESFDVLSNPNTREEYDKKISSSKNDYDTISSSIENTETKPIEAPSYFTKEDNGSIDFREILFEGFDKSTDAPVSVVEPEEVQFYSTADSDNKIDFSGNIFESTQTPVTESDEAISAFIKDDNNKLNFSENDYENIGEPVETQITDNSHMDQSSSLQNKIFNRIKYKPSSKTQFASFEQAKGNQMANNATKVLLSSLLGYSVLGPFGLVGAGVLMGIRAKRKLAKTKLTKENYTKIITDIQTEESNIISQANERLMQNINVTSKNKGDFKLQMNALKYKNQVELLKQIIDMRKQTKKKQGNFINSELRIYALRLELLKAKRNLNYIRKMLKNDSLEENLNQSIEVSSKEQNAFGSELDYLDSEQSAFGNELDNAVKSR